ncbi:MAG: alpha/beta hydrolase [Rhodospirillaceae bacterium]
MQWDIDWSAAPADVVAGIAARGRRLETPCGGGAMVWHRWDGLADGSDRAPVVLLHGGWGSWTHWIRTVPHLAAQRTVIAADLPGMGDSADAPEPHTADSLSTIVADGIDALLPDGAPFHAVGFSFGGVMGTWAAARYGRRCRSMTLVGAAGFGRLHVAVTGITIPDPTLPDTEIDAVHRRNLGLLMLHDEARIDPLAVHIHRANIARGRVRSRRISVSEGVIDVLPKVAAPLGGIWGEADATGGGRAAIEARRDILRDCQPDCLFDIIDGAGHWIMYEAPERFAAILDRHLGHHEGKPK